MGHAEDRASAVSTQDGWRKGVVSRHVKSREELLVRRFNDNFPTEYELPSFSSIDDGRITISWRCVPLTLLLDLTTFRASILGGHADLLEGWREDTLDFADENVIGMVCFLYNRLLSEASPSDDFWVPMPEGTGVVCEYQYWDRNGSMRCTAPATHLQLNEDEGWRMCAQHAIRHTQIYLTRKDFITV